MIVGSGIDLAEIGRIQQSIDRYGSRFLNRVYTAGEQAYCLRKRNSAESLAARFAAKEAFFKALGTGWIENTLFNEVEIINNIDGKPEIHLSGLTQNTINAMGINRILVSLSHIKTMASAIVILEKQ